MISRKYKIPYIYFGVVKTGSTSMRNILKHQLSDSYGKHTKIVDGTYPYFKEDRDHTIFIDPVDAEKADQLPKDLYLAVPEIILASELAQFYKFITVRNPFDRMFSLFRFRILKDNIKRHNIAEGTRLSAKFQASCAKHQKLFESYLQRIEIDISAEGYNRLPCYDYCSSGGEMYVDDIIRFENYENDVRKVLKKLECPPGFGLTREGDLYIPHDKETSSFSYQDVYTKVSRNIVENLFADGLNYFNYSF